MYQTNDVQTGPRVKSLRLLTLKHKDPQPATSSNLDRRRGVRESSSGYGRPGGVSPGAPVA